MALKGAEVVCSDLNGPEEDAKQLHKKYGVENKITYEAIDATNISYNNYFDMVVFKSVLGGIGYNNCIERQEKAIEQIHNSLKPGGVLFFAENLSASLFHRICRKYIVSWGNRWRYVTLDELNIMLKGFTNIKINAVGFTGAFGRNNNQRNILGEIDKIFDQKIPEKWRYIAICSAFKNSVYKSLF